MNLGNERELALIREEQLNWSMKITKGIKKGIGLGIIQTCIKMIKKYQSRLPEQAESLIGKH